MQVAQHARRGAVALLHAARDQQEARQDACAVRLARLRRRAPRGRDLRSEDCSVCQVLTARPRPVR